MRSLPQLNTLRDRGEKTAFARFAECPALAYAELRRPSGSYAGRPLEADFVKSTLDLGSNLPALRELNVRSGASGHVWRAPFSTRDVWIEELDAVCSRRGCELFVNDRLVRA